MVPTPPTRCPSQVAPRATLTSLLAHSHPLAEHPNQNPKHPSTDLPPSSVPTAYCRRRAPEQPAEAARQSLAADCESAGSTQCLLAAATWCQRWQPALTTCVRAPAPPATPLSAESERTVAVVRVQGAINVILGGSRGSWDVWMVLRGSKFNVFLAKLV